MNRWIQDYYGRQDALKNLKPTRIGQGTPAYMEGFNEIRRERNHEELPLKAPDVETLAAMGKDELFKALLGYVASMTDGCLTSEEGNYADALAHRKIRIAYVEAARRVQPTKESPEFYVTAWNWENGEDGEKAVEALEEKLKHLPPNKKQLLFDAVNDRDQELPEFYLELEQSAIAEVLNEYKTYPQSGHGLQIDGR